MSESTYYHVAANYDGGTLETLADRLQSEEDACEAYTTKWPAAGALAPHHIHQIHLYATLGEARDHARDYGGDILRIDDPNGELDIEIDELEFAHPVCNHSIDTEYVSLVIS